MEPPDDKILYSLINRFRKLFLLEGVVFTLLGIFAIAMPGLFSLTLNYLLGWLFVFAAIAQGIRAALIREMPNRSSTAISTLLYLTLGILLFVYPTSGILTLTLLLGFFFVIDGFVKIYAGMQLKPEKASGLIILSGALSLILAVIVFSYWPEDAPWILGIFVGINLLITGVTTLGYLWGHPSKE